MFCRDHPSMCRARQRKQKSPCANNCHMDGEALNRIRAALHVGKLQAAQSNPEATCVSVPLLVVSIPNDLSLTISISKIKASGSLFFYYK